MATKKSTYEKTNYLNEEPVPPEEATVEEAKARCNQARRDLDRWEAELAPALEIFRAAEEELSRAKSYLAQVMMHHGVRRDEDPDFEYTMVRKDDGEYRVDRLPSALRNLDGVVLSKVDKKAVQKAIDRGIVTEEEAKAAWVPRLSKPSLRVSVKTES